MKAKGERMPRHAVAEDLPRSQRAMPHLFAAPCREQELARDAAPSTGRAIRRAGVGDQEAMGYLYEQYAGSVYQYVHSLVHDEYEAQDLTQLVFLKLLWMVDRYDARLGGFSSWLLRVARNLTIDHLRRRRPILSDAAVVSGAATAAPDTYRRRALYEALAELSSEQRAVLLLRQVVGLRPAEIAQRMDKTEGSVHALHHRAQVAMRSSLSRLEAAPASTKRT
jgi:RNA polymerase sigma-70 factor, ECF subfamily